ncbi:hypothetical protein GO013_07385 [Pseudodesulfovibrio sp. JC047]|uniref:hypothetical protein n=1 Tax=Pseudodesulfovibrio sp. JC047 TaxID=2683199 RepID=UPI0013D737D6|nr:hypothetical protein [Pseudodesulfovibrio sp. JC047]NDV19241.1 hypothetical protein [Pseudodesulfovibrio sp. JC047]
MPKIEFERYFINASIKLAIEQGMNHTQFAKHIYGDSATSATRWRMMRNGDKGIYPKVSLSFARDIAKALNTDLPSLIFRVDQQYQLNTRQDEKDILSAPITP